MGLKRMHSSRIFFAAPHVLAGAATATLAANETTMGPSSAKRAASAASVAEGGGAGPAWLGGRPTSGDVAAAGAAKRAPITGEERHRMIAKAAYGRAERTGFRSDPIENWLVAEREVDALLARLAS
jgi:hypothetical protein